MPGAENDAQSLRVNRMLLQAGIDAGQIGRREGQLDVAAHHLQAFSRPNVLLGVEIGHHAADGRRQIGLFSQVIRRMPLRPSPKAAQNGSFPMPIGLTMPMPVTTISCCSAIWQTFYPNAGRQGN